MRLDAGDWPAAERMAHTAKGVSGNKEGMLRETAVEIIREGRGAHFDPDMVDAFVEIQEEFRSIAERYADSDMDLQQKAVLMAGAVPEPSRA